MVVGEVAEPVDLLVLGGGPAGYAAAIHAAHRGRDVVLVDRDGPDGVGGVCLRVGCIPSKALIELASAAERTHHFASAGLITGEVSVDLKVFQQDKERIVGELTEGVRSLVHSAGVRLIGGTARFTRPDQVVLETPAGHAQFLQFRDVVIATGSRPALLPHLVPDGERIVDSTGALGLDQMPSRVAVVGAGYIGVELGTAFAKLGAKTTLIEVADRVLPDMDAALVRPVARRLAELGIVAITNAQVGDYEDGDLVVHNAGAADRRLDVDLVIVAVGRRPNTDNLGLDRLGISTDQRGLLDVEPNRTIRKHVAAIGDITAGPALAHKAYAEAPVAVAALCGDRVAFEPRGIPAVVFSDPEVATLGLTLAAAQSLHLDAELTSVPIRSNGRAMTLRSSLGTVQLVSEIGSGVLLGAHVAGPHASEIISEASVALEMGATTNDLADIIHVHPTVSEQMQEAARVASGRALHAVRPRNRN